MTNPNIWVEKPPLVQGQKTPGEAEIRENTPDAQLQLLGTWRISLVAEQKSLPAFQWGS